MAYPNALPAGSLEARIAAELRSELARQGHSRRWLAAATGLPHVTVARWCRGDTTPSIGDLDAMCSALGTTVVRLLIEVERRPAVRPREVAGEQLIRPRKPVTAHRLSRVG